MKIYVFQCLVSVLLIGGTLTGTGNVFARNPTTGIYGPVCDDLWDMNDVIHLLCIQKCNQL